MASPSSARGVLLSLTGTYALRVTAWLALHGEAPISSGDLARAAEVPEAYLSKILRRLVVAGVLESHKGRHGGFALAHPPEQVRFFDVLDAVDALPPGTECAFGWGRCSDDDPCPLHEAWTRFNSAWRHWAMSHTLADATDPAATLERRGRGRVPE